MRRSVITGAILACLLAFLPSTAGAHPGSTVFRIDVGVPTSISVLVPADYGHPIDRIELADAKGFELQSSQAPAGWQVTRTGDRLAFTGPAIPPYGFTVLVIRGVAPAKGELVFPVTTSGPDGSVMHYTGGPGTTDQATILYAGITPHIPSKKGFPWLTVAGAVLVAVGVLGTGAILVRGRRRANPPAGPPQDVASHPSEPARS